jgi:hypothetical protein
MAANVIDNISVVNWIFSSEEKNNYTRYTLYRYSIYLHILYINSNRSFLWEILHNTINKTLSRTELLRNSLKEAEIALEKGNAII